MFGGGLEEGEALVFAGELVGVVDAVVAGGAEGGLVGGAVQGCLALAADVAEDLHLDKRETRKESGGVVWCGDKNITKRGEVMGRVVYFIYSPIPTITIAITANPTSFVVCTRLCTI